jgi:hypothetical protein
MVTPSWPMTCRTYSRLQPTSLAIATASPLSSCVRPLSRPTSNLRISPTCGACLLFTVICDHKLPPMARPTGPAPLEHYPLLCRGHGLRPYPRG